jgi:ribosomal-protein-alanine N-acetyltransferase
VSDRDHAGDGAVELALEPAGVAWAGPLARLLAQAMRGAWSEAMVRECLEAGAIAVIRRDDAAPEPDALAALGILRVVETEAEILQVAVAARWQRRGLGTHVVRRLLSECALRGVRDVFLEVRAGNVAARALYEREGFAEAGRRAAYYADGEDALVMARRLEFPLPPG